MRTLPLIKTAVALMCALAMGFVAPLAKAQISVGPSGVATVTFGSVPPAAEWSTYSVAGGAGDVTTASALDPLVQANFAGLITAQLASSNANPPNATALAVWSTAGYAQTRVTGNRFALLMATLRNNTGSNISALNIAYDFTNATTVTEEILGHRAYFSTNGATGSWQVVSSITGAAGRKTANLYVGLWTNNATCYILWADDNGSGSPDSANQIDNFSASAIPAAPIITVQPQPMNVAPGSAASFNVSAAGLQPLFYQWRKNSNNIPNATSSTYTIASAQVGDQGFYSVVVSNAAGTVTSTNVFLTVLCNVASFTSQPSSQTVNAGVVVTLSSSVAGTVPITYQWYKDGGLISGATSPSHTLNPAYVADAGTYHVAVTNCAGGFVSTNAVLTVNCLPIVITTQPANQGVNAGSPLTLTTAVTGSPIITYQWFKNYSAVSGETNAAFTRASAVVGDSGLYYATIVNCAGTFFTRTAVVAVADAPYVLLGLTNSFWKYEQTGTDLGTAWQGTNYDDSAWPSGRGIMALETDAAFVTARTNTVLSLSNAGVRTVTYYFRNHFTLTNDPRAVTLIASNIIDDGTVVYLNGSEIYRIGMPAADPAYTTLANVNAAEGVFTVTNLPTDKLIQGDNVLAVEVHQNTLTSSDIVFGMHVNVLHPVPTLLVITNQPQNFTVEETKPATFTLGLSGTPAYYQWYKDGVAISNGIANPFTIQVTSTNDAGTYYVVATNIINAVTSSVVLLTIIPDTNAPVLVEADGTLANTKVLVSFSELIGNTAATNKNNYAISNTIGGYLTISSAVLTNGTNVLLTTSARAGGQNYILVVNNIKDISPRQNIIVANSSIPIIGTFVNLVPVSAQYEFIDPFPPFDSADQGTNWMKESSAGSWGSYGNAPFFYGFDESIMPFPVGAGGYLSQTDPVTSFYRRAFSGQSLSRGGLKLTLQHLIDDGAVIYLNGTEIYRFNMPAGNITYSNSSASQANALVWVDPIPLPTEQLRSGQNFLAVELHQWVANDLDKVFAAQLDARAMSVITGPVVITGGPGDRTVSEGQSATFSVVQAGGQTFQWQLNSNTIAGATNPTYTVASATLAMDGYKYRVQVTNPSNSIFSTNATLRVIADTNAPTLVSGYANTNNTITISFSEAITAATANNVTNYVVTNSLSQSLAVSSATLNNGTNVVLAFASLPYATYTVFVSNVRDISGAGNVILPNSPIVVGYQNGVVAMGGSWRYNQSGSDLGTEWRSLAYEDIEAPWTNGLALFEAKAGVVPAFPEPVRTTLVLSNGPTSIVTYYFRTHFNSYAAGAGQLTFRTILDDGAVIYLNGAEVYRMRMPTTPILYGTLANVNVGDAGAEGPFTVDVTNVLAGDNLIAVEVHQQSLTSSDITWAGQFSVNVPSSIPVAPQAVQILLHPQGRTNSVGANVQLNVVATGAAPINYQWRKNGTNVLGATNTLLSLNPAQITDSGVYSVVVNNWMSSATSSNATVLITNACAGVEIVRPTLNRQLSGTNLVLSWVNPPLDTCGAPAVFTLQRALYLSNAPIPTAWVNVTNASPVTVGLTNKSTFYRLKR